MQPANLYRQNFLEIKSLNCLYIGAELTRRIAVKRTGPPFLQKGNLGFWRTANHIFGPKSLARHRLAPLLKAFGGDAVAATYRLQNAAQALANQGAIKGLFQATVDVAGQTITIRGAVIDGIVNLSTAFIP